MIPYIANPDDAVGLLRAALEAEYNNHDLSDYTIADYDCTLREVLESLLDALARGIV